jgi:hypothetical protein
VAVGNRCLLLVAMGRGLEAQAELRRSLASSPGDERLLAAWKRITSPA